MLALLIFAACLTSGIFAESKLPSFINVCKRSDPKLTECLTKNFNVVIKMLSGDLPELGLEMSDPFRLNAIQLEFGHNTNTFQFNCTFIDVKVHGISNGVFMVHDVKFDDTNVMLNLTLDIPFAQLESRYMANGKILVPFESRGLFFSNSTNLKIDTEWSCVRYLKKNGKEHLRLVSSVFDVRPQQFKINYQSEVDLGRIGEATRNILNDNADALYDEIKPVLDEVIKSIVFKLVRNVFKKFSNDVLFPL